MGGSNATASVQAIVDTGFTGYLTLPTNAVRAPGLQFAIEEEMTLANGEPITFDVYSAAIEWNGQLRRVRVHSSEGDPIIGMAMLRDHDLHVRAIPERRGKHRSTRLAEPGHVPTDPPPQARLSPLTPRQTYVSTSRA